MVAGEWAGRFDSAKGTAEGLGVYIVKVGGQIVYVGRSRDLARRMNEQKNRFGDKATVVGLSFGKFGGRESATYKATRALEDLLIRELISEKTTLANKINGMSDKDPKKRRLYQELLQASLNLLN